MAPAIDGLRRCSKLVADSPPMQALMRRAALVAGSDASVLITGETGTGKEVLARALHANSPRARRPFIALNVAAIPAELLESELFGHVRGAFTGAIATRSGLLEAASGGTLMLDEIGEMPAPMQAKLLRALQDGEVRKVGDTRTTAVDVRIICATHRDLVAHVEQGSFRRDLLYRLRVFSFHVPPLRERPEDLMPLLRMFLALEGLPEATVDSDAWKLLRSWPWPGNVRELANVVQHAAVLARAEPAAGLLMPRKKTAAPATRISVRHLPEELAVPPTRRPRPGGLLSLAQVERAHIESVLQACGGNQVEAARILGIGRNTLWRKLKN
jgi:two-component system response regulator HydG